MIFYATASDLRVQIAPGGYLPDPHRPGIYQDVPGNYAQFAGGVFETEDEGAIEVLRKHPSYGYGKGFWSEIDRPESVAIDEEIARLRAENLALKRLTNATVNVTVERTETKAESGTEKLNRLRKEATALGIKVERAWVTSDFEDAIAKVKGD